MARKFQIGDRVKYIAEPGIPLTGTVTRAWSFVGEYSGKQYHRIDVEIDSGQCLSHVSGDEIHFSAING